MNLLCIVTPHHTYHEQLKVVVKTFAKNAHQNQAINIENAYDQYIKGRLHRDDMWGRRFYPKDV